MAKTNVYDQRKLRGVVISHPSNSALTYLYCFRTSVDASEVNALGQVDLSSGIIPGGQPAIIGARFPRPTKLRSMASGVSSYCASDKVQAALQSQVWKTVEKSKFLAPRTQNTTAPTSITAAKGSVIASVKAKTDGGDIMWGWRMPKYQLVKISASELAGLGVVFPTTDAEWRAVTLGVNAPYPPRAIKNLATNTTSGTGKNTVTNTTVETASTFYDYTQANLPENWSPQAGGKYKVTIFE